MPRADILPSETDAERGGYVVVDETGLYVGDLARIRDLVKRTGAGKSGKLFSKRQVNGVTQNVRARAVRTTLVEITRVAAGKDGATYITGKILSSECPGEDAPGNDRWRHKIGTTMVSEGLRELSRLPGSGPSEDVRDTMSATTHSTTVRMANWETLLLQAIDAGISRPVLTDALVAAGDRIAQSSLARRSSEKVARGGTPLVAPVDLGEAEAAAVRSALAGTSEPEHWMWPVLANAVRDPDAFVAEFGEIA